MTAADSAGRVLFLIRVPLQLQDEFLAAYQQIRHLVAAGVPGHARDQVCQSITDPEQWLITSEWRHLADFEAWEATDEHRELVAPMRRCFTEARSLRFAIRAQTVAEPMDAPTRVVPDQHEER